MQRVFCWSKVFAISLRVLCVSIKLTDFLPGIKMLFVHFCFQERDEKLVEFQVRCASYEAEVERLKQENEDLMNQLINAQEV